MRIPGAEKGKWKRQGTTELPAAADLFVRDLPGLQLNESSSSWTARKPPALYGGNLPSVASTSTSDAHLYFLLATNRHIPRRQRLLIWFNGGPGCSSFDGAFIEIGPIRVNPDMSVSVVEGTAWNEYANVLFIDQPAGTGYSYMNEDDGARELPQAAEHVVTFLSNFYSVFPEYRSMDTYLAGESYAGQWIPYIADAMLDTATLGTPLKGLLIGNGWISPKHQYPAYLDYLVERDIIKKGSQPYHQINGAVDACNKEFKRREESGEGDKGTVLVPLCENILGVVAANTKKGDECMNLYDTTSFGPCGRQWPPALEWTTPYLQRDDVVNALHGEGSLPRKWTQCSSTVAGNWWSWNSRPAVVLLPKLLEKIPILLFAGDRDAMCAGTGIKAMIDDLEWNGATGWNGTEPTEWFVDGKQAGLWRTARSLTYVDVYDSSHMVPIDSPLAAHDMALRFMDVDTINAAGGAARVPSRVGNETEALVGPTHPNGTALIPVDEEGLAESEPAKSITDDGFDRLHELRYGPRRTAFLFLFLLLFSFAIWSFFRWRARRRRLKYSQLKGKGRGGAGIRLEESSDEMYSRRGDLESGRRHNNHRRRQHEKQRVALPIETPTAEQKPMFDVGETEEEEDESDASDIFDAGDLGASESTRAWRA